MRDLTIPASNIVIETIVYNGRNFPVRNIPEGTIDGLPETGVSTGELFHLLYKIKDGAKDPVNDEAWQTCRDYKLMFVPSEEAIETLSDEELLDLVCEYQEIY